MTINSVTVSNTTYSSDSATTATSSSAGDTSSKLTTSSETTQTDSISQRAKNVQKINEEFFADGTFTVSDALIERLAEYGLISNAERDTLLASSASADVQNTSTELSALQDSVNGLIERISAADSDSPLLATLKDAQTLLSDLDSYAMTSKQAEKLLTDLEAQVSQSPVALADSDVKALKELDLVLQIANKLSLQNTSSDAINAYLAVYKGQ